MSIILNDINKYLYTFINIQGLLNLATVNKFYFESVHKLIIIKKYLEFKISEGKNTLVDFTCANNYIELLDHIYKTDIFDYTYKSIHFAAKYSHWQVFEWFRIKKIKYDYGYFLNRYINIHAIINKQPKIIEWLKKYQDEYEPDDINSISLPNHKLILFCNYNMVDDLEIFNKSNPTFIANFLSMCTTNFFGTIITEGNIQIIEWFHYNHSKYLNNYLPDNIKLAINYNRYSIIKWFVDHKYIIHSLNILIKFAKDRNRTDVVLLLESTKKNI